LQRQEVGPLTRFAVTTEHGTVDLPLGKAIAPLPVLSEDLPLPRLAAEGDVVFAGYALNDPALHRDDLAHLDLAGKTVVFLVGAPPSADPALRASLERPEALGRRLATIADRRPAAIIAAFAGVNSTQVQALADELDDASVTLASGSPDSARSLPMVLFAVARPGSPLLPPGWPRDDRPQALRDHRFRGRLDLVVAPVPAYNIVGVVRGRDPAFAQSYVALGAHLDHIGVQSGVSGDSIANGADDDGSGSVALLAIARSLQTMAVRPRRSTLFVWHTAEELGLYGSAWFTSHPTVPIDSIVAQLNADMIGRNGPDSLYLVGPAAAPNGQSSVLGAIVDSVNASLPRPFTINREWDSPSHPEQIYYRSDHYNYARHGIPIVFFTSGLHPQYHRVTDEAPLIDFDKLARVATFLLESDIAVANRTTRPLPSERQRQASPTP
jgi:hypothetical protein